MELDINIVTLGLKGYICIVNAFSCSIQPTFSLLNSKTDIQQKYKQCLVLTQSQLINQLMNV